MSWVAQLLSPLKATGAPWQFPQGASEEMLREAEIALGYAIDDDYKALLRFPNGPFIDPRFAGFTSVSSHGENSFTNAVSEDARKKHWLPITTDGCGNDYAIVTLTQATGRPVAFFESSRSLETPVYCVASSFRKFLNFLVSPDGHRSPGWPFDPLEFERFDPDFLENVASTLHPWNN